MQFHHHGYVSGDPRIQPAAGVGIDRPEQLPDEVDVLIVGTGPAGVVTAAQLSQFPGVTTRIVERRGGRLAIGQADGIQARSVETFQAFGFAERIIAEAYRITEMAFWKPDPADPSRIVRAARTLDDPAGISEFPHLIVNQARVLDYFTEVMAYAPTRMKPDYGYEFRGLQVGDGEYPVTVTLAHTTGPEEGRERVIRAKYVVGADGARSKVRESIGCTLAGDQANHAWGVMDVLANTDFPDIRTKCAITSGSGGSILLIPREGGHLFRMYVDLGVVPEGNAGAVRSTSIEQIIARANDIIHPYSLDVRNVAWHSVYEVGHRLTDRFDDVLPDQLGTRTAAGVHHRRRLPHPQRQGRSGHERLHAGRLQPWLEARTCAGGPQPGEPAVHLLGRAPGRREEPHRLRQGMVDADGQEAGGICQPVRAGGLLRQHRRVPGRIHDPVRPVHADRRSDAPGPGHRVPHRQTFQVRAGGPRLRHQPARSSVTRPRPTGAGGSTSSRTRHAAGAPSPTTDLADWLANAPDSPLAATPEGADRDAWFDVKVIYQQDHTSIDIGAVPAVFKPPSVRSS